MDNDDACERYSLARGVVQHLLQQPTASPLLSRSWQVMALDNGDTYGHHFSLEASSYSMQISVADNQISLQRRLRWVARHWLFFVMTCMYNLLGLNMMVTFVP